MLFDCTISYRKADGSPSSYTRTVRAENHDAALKQMTRHLKKARQVGQIDGGTAIPRNPKYRTPRGVLIDALRRLRYCPDLNLDDLEDETVAACAQADKALNNLAPENTKPLSKGRARRILRALSEDDICAFVEAHLSDDAKADLAEGWFDPDR